MKAIILAAGRGSRLGDLTRAVPKPLLEVGGKRVLQRHLEMCARGGIREVFINTHYLADRIRSFVGDGSAFGLDVKYSYEPDLLGTAGALRSFADDLSRGRFVVIYGDNMVETDLRSIERHHLTLEPIATMALHHRDDVSMSGMVLLDADGRIRKIIEKPPPEEQVSNLVNAGIYILEPRILEWIPEGVSDFARDVFPALLRAGEPVAGFVLPETLSAIDTPELLAEARKNARAGGQS